MKTLDSIVCFITYHLWAMPDGSYPTHGYHEIPYPGAVCSRCDKIAE